MSDRVPRKSEAYNLPGTSPQSLSRHALVSSGASAIRVPPSKLPFSHDTKPFYLQMGLIAAHLICSEFAGHQEDHAASGDDIVGDIHVLHIDVRLITCIATRVPRKSQASTITNHNQVSEEEVRGFM